MSTPRLSEAYAPFRLQYLGEAALRAPAEPVEAMDVPHALVSALIEACRVHSAIGLAAQHVGGAYAVIVATIDGQIVPMLNPRVTEQSVETETALEGSVSMPGFQAQMTRPVAITVAYRDMEFRPITRRLTGLEARCVQHEVDHLRGVLLTDGLSRTQRRQAERLSAPFIAPACRSRRP
jgi:peptide deformylase